MKKSDTLKLYPGDHWSRSSFGKVVSAGPNEVVVENDQGVRWSIDPPLFESEFTTANQFAETKKVTRTEMVNQIVSSPRMAMTIFFHKKPEHTELVDFVEQLCAKGQKMSRRSLSAALKSATAGAERTMVGRHFGTTDEFGHIQFLDVESSSPGLKTIDPRTVEWATIDNVRYQLK